MIEQPAASLLLVEQLRELVSVPPAKLSRLVSCEAQKLVPQLLLVLRSANGGGGGEWVTDTIRNWILTRSRHSLDGRPAMPGDTRGVPKLRRLHFQFPEVEQKASTIRQHNPRVGTRSVASEASENEPLA